MAWPVVDRHTTVTRARRRPSPVRHGERRRGHPAPQPNGRGRKSAEVAGMD